VSSILGIGHRFKSFQERKHLRNLQINELAALLKEFVIGGRFLKQTPKLSRDEMLAWQFVRIQKLVAYAWQHIPFYCEHYGKVDFEPDDLKSWDAFHQLPLVTKDDVINHFPDQMLRTGYNLDDLIVSRSSGSSGKVLDICYDSEAMVIYSLAGLRLYQMGFKYRPWHNQLYVYTSPYPMDSVFGLYPMHHVSTLTEIPQIAAAIERIRPELLVCYPSHLKQIEPALSERAKSRLKSVSVNSEMSTQAERDYLSERLGCPVLDEYSSEELTRIAAQCSCGNYHIFEDINYIECVNDSNTTDNEPGIIVGTNLHNYAMPMIRYVQNDLGTLIEKDCGCGWKFRHLVNLQGRKNDSFLMPSGKEISSGFLLDATYEILLTWRDAVVDFCLIQRAFDQIVLQVIPDAGWTASIEAKIIERFGQFFETGVGFRIDIVEECEKTKSGKRNPIIRRFDV
jgi:Coenzyme F390 synthetase